MQVPSVLPCSSNAPSIRQDPGFALPINESKRGRNGYAVPIRISKQPVCTVNKPIALLVQSICFPFPLAMLIRPSPSDIIQNYVKYFRCASRICHAQPRFQCSHHRIQQPASDFNDEIQAERYQGRSSSRCTDSKTRAGYDQCCRDICMLLELCFSSASSFSPSEGKTDRDARYKNHSR